jgi:cytosine/uracil/thiamine/allantoin permease
MSYLQFLLLFLVAPTALLLAAHGPVRIERTLSVIGVMAVVGVLYMAPWLHLLVAKAVLDYGPDKVEGTLWAVAWEQYAFAALQVAFTATLAVLVLRRVGWKS